MVVYRRYGTQVPVNGFDVKIFHFSKQGPGHDGICFARVTGIQRRVTVMLELIQEHFFRPLADAGCGIRGNIGGSYLERSHVKDKSAGE